MNVCLNGEWHLALDNSDIGIKEEWYRTVDLPTGVAAEVPSTWEPWLGEYHGVAWYFKDFTLPALGGRHVELMFEAVGYFSEVWLNGVRLGDHEGAYTPFVFDATQAAREGANRVSVRVVDPHGASGHAIFRPGDIPTSDDTGPWGLGGIWGTVGVNVKSQSRIRSVFVEPDIRRKRVNVTVEGAGAGEVRLSIEGTSCTSRGGFGKQSVEFPEHQLWSGDTPVLYTLRSDLLEAGEVVDTVLTRFGMREFTVKENRFYLNNHPIFIKGVIHDGTYPRPLSAATVERWVRKELELAKAAGFNLIRLHKTAPSVVLEVADELGLLVYEEPPIGWLEKSPWLEARCGREVREMVVRDRNHASVVIWGILNETGNANHMTRGGVQSLKEPLCRLARSLDPSRLIIDDSGGMNMTREPSRLMRPYHDTFEAYDDFHIWQRSPVDREIQLYYAHNGDVNKTCFLSAFGFGGMEDLTVPVAEAEKISVDKAFFDRVRSGALPGFQERGLDRLFGNLDGLAAATREVQSDGARYQFDACRANGRLSGYCYDRLCDGNDQFSTGLLDRWRNPKLVYTAITKSQKPVRPLIQVPRTNLLPREEVSVVVTLTNDARLEGQADLSLQVVGPTNQVLWKKRRGVKIPKGGKELWTGSIAASGSAGTHQFVVRLLQGMTCLGESAVDLHVFEPVEATNIDVNVVDPQRVWQERCSKFSNPGTIMAPIHVVPPLANTIRAYPDNELMQVLAQVKGGAVAIFFEPPEDWNDLAERVDASISATTRDAVGGPHGVYHYAKLHPVFDGLPARGLMRQPYRNAVAARTFVEVSDEDICGTIDTSAFAGEDPGSAWGTDILVRRYGSGRIVFTHLRLLEHLGKDPVSDRLFVNLLRHFSRRSVPPDGLQSLDQRAVEWMRGERNERVRRWLMMGPFPNWEDKGHDTAYPPEQGVQPDATYPGWYTAVRWKPWCAKADDGFVVDLQQAFTPVYGRDPRFDYGTGYAYAEFTSERRDPATATVRVQDATKVWLNGNLIHDSKHHLPHDEFSTQTESCIIRQGRNTLLVKVSKTPGPFKFSVDFSSATKEPLQLKWWR